MKLTWLLALKIFIILFWILGMVGFIVAAIDNHRTFLELLARWDIALIFVVILFGCVSVILDFIFKDKNIMVSYFLSFFLLTIFYTFVTMCMRYIRFLNDFVFTNLIYLITSRKTIYIALWFMFIGVYLCGFVSYFQKNYKRAKLCLAFCFINYIPFVFIGQITFGIK